MSIVQRIARMFGWRPKAPSNAPQIRDCFGGSPCSTCPDKRVCSTGCIRPITNSHDEGGQ